MDAGRRRSLGQIVATRGLVEPRLDLRGWMELESTLFVPGVLHLLGYQVVRESPCPPRNPQQVVPGDGNPREAVRQPILATAVDVRVLEFTLVLAIFPSTATRTQQLSDPTQMG